ncbi:M23 family metallopeptidase [Streptomyces milbemycinicus]|uniref:Peptidoglycan DD-metalloendopeptidase family protein n=1 Tax=Streptomyces milbemycinicus TaxID=476552 RepID=A0ABW8LRY2_9ACTN
MVNERHAWGSPTPIDHAPDASRGTCPENEHQGAQRDPEGYVGYGDEDLLFGPRLSTHDTGAYTSSESGTDWYSTDSYSTYRDGARIYNSTAAAPDHVQSAYQASYNADGYDTTAIWDAPGYPRATSRVVGADVVDTSGHEAPAQWADSTDEWHTGRPVPSRLGSEAQSHTWSTSPYTDPYSPFDPTASPGSPGSPAEESPGRTSPQPTPEPKHTAVSASLPEEPEDTSQAISKERRTTPPRSRRVDARNRRASARRSALLTVAVPSVAVMGMTGVAAVSVGVDDQGERAAPAALDATPAIDPSVANGKIDAQLAGLTTDAHDFADRASRTQERIDLRQRQLEEQRRRVAAEAAHRKAEAARKEALRPKFALPVAQRGIGELFGAAGSMWSNRHTGLDFPVPMNTLVMAVTDGTVEAKWNQFYGNMVIVTAPDGTETWYCHLASAKIRAGQVKAGDVIAYAGSSGNSSGPHLHLEVHPGGGDAIDPLAWLRSHGLDPT